MKNYLKEKVNPESLVSLFSQSPVALSMLMGEDFVIEAANHQMLELWGKPHSIIGKTLMEALPELEGQEFPGILKQVYETGKAFHGSKKLCFLQREGVLQKCYFDFIYSPMYDEDGKITGVSVVATEVTNQVVSEIKLKDSELRFKDLILNSDVATAIYIGEDLIIELANDRMLATWGKDKSVIGLPLEKAVPELEGQPFIEILKDVYRKGETYSATEDEAKLMRDGVLESNYYTFSYKPIRNALGEIYGILNMAVDVTDLVHSKKELQESAEKLKLSEAKYKNLSAVMPQIVWTTDTEGNFTYFNDRIFKYFDISKEHLGKSSFASFIHQQDLRKVADVWFDAKENKKGFEVEYRAKRKDSEEYVWLLTRAIPELDDEGNIKQWIGTSVDINELKLLQNQKDTFLGIASHELKTPLTSIKLYAQVLERTLKKSGDEKAADYAKKMNDQVDKLSSLIKDLLDVTRINSGKIQLNEAEFSFNELVNELTEEQQLTCKHKIINQCDDVGTVFADKHRVGQVITNFLTNAIKYSPNADSVIVNAKNTGDSVVFSVQDFGIGLPEDKTEKVFEQYFRVSGDEQSTFSGLGLGLYIASQIIERSNGRIWVESKLGEGSTFYFSLPKSEI